MLQYGNVFDWGSNWISFNVQSARDATHSHCSSSTSPSPLCIHDYLAKLSTIESDWNRLCACIPLINELV